MSSKQDTEFVGTPWQMAKAIVMGLLVAEDFAKHGPRPEMLARMSPVADAILTHAIAPVPVAPVVPVSAVPVRYEGPSPQELQRQFGGMTLPGMPSPQGNPAHIVPSPPGLGSPEAAPASTGHLGVGPLPSAPSAPTAEGPVLDLSQPR